MRTTCLVSHMKTKDDSPRAGRCPIRASNRRHCNPSQLPPLGRGRSWICPVYGRSALTRGVLLGRDPGLRCRTHPTEVVGMASGQPPVALNRKPVIIAGVIATTVSAWFTHGWSSCA